MIAINIPRIKPVYEKEPVIEKLPIKNIAVSNPSLRIAKNTTRKTPHPDAFIAFLVSFSNPVLSLTCLDSQKITYQRRPAVIYINTPSKRAVYDSFPIDSFILFRAIATKILAMIAAATPAHSC